MGRLVGELLEQYRAIQMAHDKAQDNNKLDHALVGLIDLLTQDPDNPEILFQLATAYLQLQQYGIAMQLLWRVVAQWPNNGHAWSNLGCCYRSMHKMDRAKAAFMKSMGAENGRMLDSLNNMASCFVNENDPDKGIAFAREAMALDPNHPKPKWNYSLLQLERMNWAEGFSYFDSGFFCNERQLRAYSNDTPDSIPWWDGTPGKTVALWDEQGLGDRLLAANMLRKLEGQVDVILECHPRLEAIYRRAFPWIEHVYPTSKDDKIEWPLKHKIDAKISVMSLSKLYWTEGKFDRTPYIKADPELLDKYREYYRTLGPGPYIGVTWAGGAPKTNTQYRSLKLSWYEPIIAEGGTWISLQYQGWAKEKVDKYRHNSWYPIYHNPAAQEANYDETLAALAACDLTISANNTVIHTCGAAGYPCWVLTPRKRAWRYPDGDYFPWYGDHIKQYHQGLDMDWKPVIERVRKDFAEWLVLQS